MGLDEVLRVVRKNGVHTPARHPTRATCFGRCTAKVVGQGMCTDVYTPAMLSAGPWAPWGRVPSSGSSRTLNAAGIAPPGRQGHASEL